MDDDIGARETERLSIFETKEIISKELMQEGAVEITETVANLPLVS